LLDPARELGRPLGAALPLALVEALEGSPQHARLERAGDGVVHPVAGAQTFEVATPLGAERFVDGATVQIRDGLDGGVDRVQPERRTRPVRARLARGQLVRRQQLQQAVASAPDPSGALGEIADLADAPIVARADGEERDRDACDSRGGHAVLLEGMGDGCRPACLMGSVGEEAKSHSR
jgi:hypothetical protein